jgi:uncharacterized protein
VDIEVRDNADRHRYEATVDGELAGFTTYRLRPGLIEFAHTHVEEASEGRGVGSTLIREALEDVKRRGLAVLPFCPFVRSYIQRHPEYVDLVPESQRKGFGL